jgi:hypothetical protein
MKIKDTSNRALRNGFAFGVALIFLVGVIVHDVALFCGSPDTLWQCILCVLAIVSVPGAIVGALASIAVTGRSLIEWNDTLIS